MKKFLQNTKAALLVIAMITVFVASALAQSPAVKENTAPYVVKNARTGAAQLVVPTLPTSIRTEYRDGTVAYCIDGQITYVVKSSNGTTVWKQNDLRHAPAMVPSQAMAAATPSRSERQVAQIAKN